MGKACFKSFYEDVSEILMEDNIGKGYNCLTDLFFDFEESITSFKFENIWLNSEISVFGSCW